MTLEARSSHPATRRCPIAHVPGEDEGKKHRGRKNSQIKDRQVIPLGPRQERDRVRFRDSLFTKTSRGMRVPGQPKKHLLSGERLVRTIAVAKIAPQFPFLVPGEKKIRGPIGGRDSRFETFSRRSREL